MSFPYYKNHHNNLLEQIIICFKNRVAWLNLSLINLKIKYRRTILGPIWNVLSIIITTILMSVVWGVIFGINIIEFFPYVYLGLGTWTLISSLVNDSTTLLTEKYQKLLISLPIPTLVFFMRHMCFSFFQFFHYLPVYIILLFFFPININLYILMFFPYLLLIILNGFWIIGTVSILSSRYRDFIPLISSLMGPLSLMTPIVWKKEMLGIYENFVYLNPFTSVVELLRDSLLGYKINFLPIIILIFAAIFGNLILYLLIRFKGHRIVFWAQ